MASKRTGLIARWLARRTGSFSPEAGAVPAPAVEAPERDAGAGVDTRPVKPTAAAPADSTGTAGDDLTSRPAASTCSGAAEPAPPATEQEATEEETTEDAASTGSPTPDQSIPAASLPDGPTGDEPMGEGYTAPADPGDRNDAEAPATAPEAAPTDTPESDAEAETGELPEDDSSPGQGATTDAGQPLDPVPAPRPDAAVPVRDHKVITLLALEEHAGATTLAAALAGRIQGHGWRIRTAGPGLLRAAFAGMLEDTDALVLVSPGNSAVTATLGEKLLWLEANDRPGIPACTLVVVNLGAGDGGELLLPADLDRPVILLPFDAALGLPGTGKPAPRRATRRAVGQLVDELTTILEGAPNTTWHTTTSPSSDRDPGTR
ncbi:hypothetical protein GCM10009715_06820 [Paeniglutamicibacter psychrophenolicus]|uniref:TIR domain-containing protein n=1 Tax=Paeniglutamicibacter psychrophenolicus TaxID=257454 RepID=A0ABS4WGV7_9MICC|nr:hypothetical protein [Paeniglutamicibacter psychrophenolicus]MBP2375433.1 hypothetical protein [Paeniglutamicibacter psychrophenolicus]